VFEQAFKRIDDVLRKEAGCTTELDYTEQTSWLLFLKYLDGLERDLADQAALEGKPYSYILDEPYRWDAWAAPKTSEGKLDRNKALTGDDLRDFVNEKLFPYLQGFKQRANAADTVEYKIGEIFREIKNKISSGYNMREIIDNVDELRFRSQAEKHELSHLYEDKIKNMGNAGRNGGEYYTPRPLIRAIVEVVQPQLGESVYDGAVGSAGFLCEAYEYLQRSNPDRTTAQDRRLKQQTFYGKEKKSLAYVIAIMNMILHGIEAPNIIHTNTLSENLADVQDKDRYDVILANPPFGGAERKEIQQNFPIRSGETAYLFLQHFIKMLKAGGRGGMVIKNTFLSNDDSASVSMRKMLLETCTLETILDCPRGVFVAGVHTVVLFFQKGAPTRKIWYYQLDPGRNLGKTNALNDADLAEFLEFHKTLGDSPRSWSVDVADVDTATYNLALRNPSERPEVPHRSADDLMNAIVTMAKELTGVVDSVRRISDGHTPFIGEDWRTEGLGALCNIALGRTPARADRSYWDKDRETQNVWLSIADLLNAQMNVASDSKEYLSDKGAAITPVVKQGTLLVSFKLTLGRLAFAGRDLRTNEAIAALTIREPEKISKQYLFYYLQFFDWDKAAEGDDKIKGKTLNKNKLSALPIHYPPPAEQARIVATLEAAATETKRLDALLEREEDAIHALKTAVLRQALGGHL
jgi:type I restriction enzyme M protein